MLYLTENYERPKKYLPGSHSLLQFSSLFTDSALFVVCSYSKWFGYDASIHQNKIITHGFMINFMYVSMYESNEEWNFEKCTRIHLRHPISRLSMNEILCDFQAVACFF